MIEMLRIYSNGFFENVTIEELTPWSLQPTPGVAIRRQLLEATLHGTLNNQVEK
jgi:hypothetical protein